MPRIPLVSESSMTDAQRRVHQAMTHGPRRSPPVGPPAAAMHRPDLAEAWSALGLVSGGHAEATELTTCGRLDSLVCEPTMTIIQCRLSPILPEWDSRIVFDTRKLVSRGEDGL